MRRLLVLALVGCAAPAKVAPAPIERARCGFDLVDLSAEVPIEGVVQRSVPGTAPVETIEGPTSTPGRHPTIPRGPITSDLDRNMLRRIIKQQMAPLVACYERLSPADRRRVVIRFTVGPAGAVLSSKASGPQGELENCIAAAFEGVTFDPPANGGTMTITYPLNFRPG